MGSKDKYCNRDISNPLVLCHFARALDGGKICARIPKKVIGPKHFIISRDHGKGVLSKCVIFSF